MTIIKFLQPYLLGVILMILLLQVYLLVVLKSNGSEYYSLITLFSKGLKALNDPSYLTTYLFGVVVSGTITMAIAKHIKSWIILFVPGLSLIILFLLVIVAYGSLANTSEMSGLGSYVIYSNLWPVNLFFSIAISIFYHFKDKQIKNRFIY